MRLPVLAVVSFLSVVGCKSEPKQDAPPKAQPLSGPVLPVPAIPNPSKWTLDPENSSATFVCKHVFANVRGMIQQPSGTVTIDDVNAANSKVEATLQVSTINTGVEERDTHLKSADFFDAAKFPTITFASTSVTAASKGSFNVVGELQMHGVSKPVTLTVAVSPPFNHAGGIRRAIEATTTVNRRDFGLMWDFPGEGTGVVVGDLIKISVDAELVLAP